MKPNNPISITYANSSDMSYISNAKTRGFTEFLVKNQRIESCKGGFV